MFLYYVTTRYTLLTLFLFLFFFHPTDALLSRGFTLYRQLNVRIHKHTSILLLYDVSTTLHYHTLHNNTYKLTRNS